MHLTDEQRRELLKQMVIEKARELLEHRKELTEMSETARAVWEALRDAPMWRVQMVQQPENWREPEEIWSEKPVIVKR